MKNVILLTCLFLFTVSGFATAVLQDVEPDRSFNAILQFFLPAILSSAIVLLSDASKWWSTGLWDWSVFFKTKIQPFLISLGVAVVIYLMLLYVPFIKPILEGMVQYNLTEVTAVALIGMATALIDNFSKKEPTAEEQRAFVRKMDIKNDANNFDSHI